MRGCTPQAENCQSFLCIFVKKISQLGRKYAYFLPIGKKYAFSTLFSFPFNHFFPQLFIWPYFCPPPSPPPGKQKSIHPCNLNDRSIFYTVGTAVFRIRLRIRSAPYHWPGSGCASGNDLDPGTKKNRDKLSYKSTKVQNYKNIIFLKRNH